MFSRIRFWSCPISLTCCTFRWSSALVCESCCFICATFESASRTLSETVGARTQGSSEAIMLGALSLKWNWRKRREAASQSTSSPNLVFGGDVHVVWEKFCRYFDVEPRIVPLQKDKYTIGPEDVRPHVDENTIGVAAVLGTTFTGHKDDIVGINNLLLELKNQQGLDVPLHVDGASGGFVWPFLYPDSPWDFRLEQVRSINVSGHKFGLVYPGIGWLVFREREDLAPDLVFEENYLGKTDATFTLNFSTGSAMVSVHSLLYRGSQCRQLRQQRRSWPHDPHSPSRGIGSPIVTGVPQNWHWRAGMGRWSSREACAGLRGESNRRQVIRLHPSSSRRPAARLGHSSEVTTMLSV